MKLTNEIVDARLVGRNIQRLGDYINTRTKIKWLCSKGHEWNAFPDTILRGHGCPKCAGNMPLTNAEVDSRLDGRNIQRLENYNGSDNKLMWHCLVTGCGHKWSATPHDILSGYGCPKCAGNSRLTNADIDNRLIGKDIQRMSDYISSSTKSPWKCLKPDCGHIWVTTSHNILNSNQGCPRCAASQSEQNIFKFLDTHNIKYVHQKKFLECKNINPLPFDFYIEQRKLLIEYQGEQHFKPSFIAADIARLKLERTQQNDAIKKAWAVANGYQLIYFTYKQTSEEINQVLKSVFLDSKIDSPLTLENKCSE